jgi:hypothetical protein
MALRILDDPTRAEVAAAETQQEQCEALIALWEGGNVTARLFAADGSTLLRTLTLGPWTINSETPRGVVAAAHLADTAVATGTPGLWVFRSGSTDVFSIDAGTSAASINHAGAVKALCTPTLAGVVFTAQSSLPVSNNNARISFWGQSNAEGSALRSGIADITADTELVDWDDGTLTFDRVMFWNVSTGAYATYVPGSNHGTESTLMGPEFAPAVWWMRNTTSGILWMGKAAWGGTSIDLFQPPSATRWTDSVSRHAAQDAWLASNGVTIPSNRTFWMWSQAEADSGQSEAWYESRMQAIVDALEANGILPYRGVLTDIPTGSPRYNAGISAAKQTVADSTGGLVVKQIEPAFPTYFEADDLHLNARGQVQRSYNAMSFFFDAETITV